MYMIVKAGEVYEALLVVDAESSARRALDAWQEIVRKEEQENFAITMLERDNEISVAGQLLITESVFVK